MSLELNHIDFDEFVDIDAPWSSYKKLDEKSKAYFKGTGIGFFATLVLLIVQPESPIYIAMAVSGILISLALGVDFKNKANKKKKNLLKNHSSKVVKLENLVTQLVNINEKKYINVIPFLEEVWVAKKRNGREYRAYNWKGFFLEKYAVFLRMPGDEIYICEPEQAIISLSDRAPLSNQYSAEFKFKNRNLRGKMYSGDYDVYRHWKDLRIETGTL